MGPRPTRLNLAESNLRPNNSDELDDEPLPPPRFPNFTMDLPSPRAGEVPPALSPLDAFALQSRMLARKFEQEAQAGRRLSRLPHMDVARQLATRPDYFRSASEGMNDVPEAEEDNRPVTRGADEGSRPKSFYPLLGRVGLQQDVPAVPRARKSYEREDNVPQPRVSSDYFGAPRASSPQPMDPGVVNVEAPSPQVPSLTSSFDSLQSASHPRTLTNGSTRSNNGLLPPRSPKFPKSPRSMKSIRSVMQDDDDTVSTRALQEGRPSRKFSGDSARSRPESPFVRSAQRSPSMTSECSLTDSHAALPMPSFNFSRPLSSFGSRQSLAGVRRSMETTRRSFDGRPSMENTGRPPTGLVMSNSSIHSASSRQSSRDDAHTPYANVPTPSELEPSTGEYFSGVAMEKPAAQTEQSFSLPRGRVMDRSSAEQRASWIEKQFHWDEGEGPTKQGQQQECSAKPAKSSIRTVLPEPAQQSKQSIDSQSLVLPRERHSESSAPRPFTGSTDSPSAPSPASKHAPSPSLISTSTDRTIRPLPLHTRLPSADMTPEEHLEIGIQAHSAGHLSKSTYHLRLAARAGLPTAMLLYALACRHGWGMRPSQEDGVLWLRKAIASSSLDLADVDSLNISSTSDPHAAATERKKRKAQFALAIYELGISYMNGWGCAKDKALAVQCFELAGNWGDADALAEAGYCYTQGVGCKKDLKKAAGLYRRAEKQGMSMAGNSWIYKSKYASPAVDSSSSSRPTPEKASMENKRFENFLTKDLQDGKAVHEKDGSSGGRSRARSIWGRKKEK